MKLNVLIIEDNTEVQSYVKTLLLENKFTVFTTGSGTKGLSLIGKIRPDLVILDLKLPDIYGEDICKYIKTYYPNTIVIILSAKGTPEDVAHGFNLGADDYLAKPFSSDELMARIHTRMKSNIAHRKKLLKLHDLTVNSETYEVKRGDKKIDLTKTEFNLLLFLIQNKGQVLTREIILSHLWNSGPMVDTRAVDVYIGYLRKKIDNLFSKKLITTINGFGYTIK